MKAVIYNRFWHSMGGGERHSGMIAEVLSHDGIEVDLLGHSEVDQHELGEHLGLDLSKTTMRIVPDKGDDHIAQLSREYDLFVNSSYMSAVIPKSRHAAYLCFFPTPFDHDLSTWRRRALHTVGPLLQDYREHLAMGWGTGWYPPEGGRRRQWTWTNGDGIIRVEPSRQPRTIQFDLGRPGATEAASVKVRDADGGLLATIDVQPEFVRHTLAVPASTEGRELHFESGTFVPGPDDSRTLGVAVSRMRLAGQTVGPRALLAGRFPWLLRDPHGAAFLAGYDTVLANSEYTRGWIQRFWQVDADVLYPPIQVERMRPEPEREPVILSVGRFFAPGLGHSKRQLEMVEMFGAMVRAGKLDGWRMRLLGGCEESQLPYLEKVRAAGANLPVEIITNAPRVVVEESMSSSSIFWSATGYGDDAERAPWAAEHFGMTTAEAMAGGCVPVVIDKAGQQEIVRPGVDGFRWSTPAQLTEQTLRVANDAALRSRLSAAAVLRAQQYSDEAFALRWRDIAAQRGLLDG